VLKSFLLRNRFRLIVLCLAVFGVAGATVASLQAKDPLYKAIETLEKQADAVLLDPSYKRGTLLNSTSGTRDRYVSLQSKTWTELLKSVRQTKLLVEAEAQKRIDFSLDHIRLASLAEVSARYLFIQRRLAMNAFRQFHQSEAAQSKLPDLDQLNLILPNNAGYVLMQNSLYGLKLNVWHINRIGQYDHVQVGLNPQDKNEAEQSVLQEQVNEQNYTNLIHLLSIRERAVNHWAIQRMSARGVLVDANLNSCAKNLATYSTWNPAQGDYYSFLSKFDQYQQFLRDVEGGLSRATFDAPLIQPVDLSRLYHQFFNSIPGYDVVQMALAPEQVAAMNHALDTRIPELANAKIEAVWQEKAKSVLLFSSYPADRWQADDVADRISWVAFDLKKTLLAKQMAAEAIEQGVTFMAKDVHEVEVLAQSTVEKAISAKAELIWRNELKTRIIAYLKSPEEAKVDQASRSHRFNQSFESIWPGIQNGTRAIFAKQQVERLQAEEVGKSYAAEIKARFNPHTDSGYIQLRKFLLKSELLVGMPARGRMKTPVYAWTPDQLSQFFYKKLAFMIEQKEFSALSIQAKKIAQNRAVMKGIEKMFGKISERYMTTLRDAKISPNDVTSEQNFLYQDLQQVIQDSYQDFARTIVTVPKKAVVAATPTPSLRDRMMPKLAIDNVRVVSRVQPVIEANDRVSKPDEAKRLFVDAVAILGLANFGLGETSAALSSKRLDSRTFLEMERQVPVRVASKAQIREAVTRSLYDQKLISEIVYGQMLSQYPLLTIQFENKTKAPSLLDRMGSRFATQGSADMKVAQGMVKGAIAVAARNQKPLIDEACSAKPNLSYDKNWRNVFRTSGTLRAILMNSDSRYKALDQSVMKSTRTWWETQLEDVVDPVAQFFFYASLVAMAVMFTPMLVGGLAGLATVGSWTVGAAGMMQTIGLTGLAATEASGAFASVALVVGKQLLKTVVGKLVMWIFTAQIAVMGYVNCYELPAHLKYQLGVANSQVGLFSKGGVDRAELSQAADLLFMKQVSTVVMASLQVVMIRPVLVGMKNVFGLTTKQALARTAAYEGNEALVAGLKEKTLNELVSDQGFWSGTGKWLSQSTASLIKTGRISSLNSQVVKEDLEAAMANKLEKMFPTVENYEAMVGERIYGIHETRKMLADEIAQLRVSNPSTALRFKNAIKNKMARYLVGGKYWNIAMSDRAKMLIAEDLTESGVQQVRHANDTELREFFIRAYEADLYQSMLYWAQKLKVVSIYKEELANGSGGEVMKQFLKGFSGDDLARHQELLNWVLLKTSSNAGTAAVRNWMGTTSEIREFKQIFKDHRILVDELNGMKPKVSPNAKAEPQAEAQAEPLILIDVDASGEVIWRAKSATEAPNANKKSFKLLFN
jgi:hypothetical protein